MEKDLERQWNLLSGPLPISAGSLPVQIDSRESNMTGTQQLEICEANRENIKKILQKLQIKETDLILQTITTSMLISLWGWIFPHLQVSITVLPKTCIKSYKNI